MEYRNITPEIKVSRLCFGALCIGYMQSDLEISAGAAVLRRAYELGVNFIDTAQLYRTYKYIKAAGLGSLRDVVICSKTYAHTRQLARDAFEEAMDELGRGDLGYIDIFMLHEQEDTDTLEGHFEALEYLLEQKKRGRIKAVGISTHFVSGVLAAIEFNRRHRNKYKLDVIHPMYNMAGLGIVDGTLADMEAALIEAKKGGFFMFAMKALGGGVLYDRAEEALRFVLAQPFIDCVAVGMKSLLEVEANAHFFNEGSFPEAYRGGYHKVGKNLHIDEWCDGCGECAKRCSQGALEISAGKARCNPAKCVLCGYCAAACEDFAIKIV